MRIVSRHDVNSGSAIACVIDCFLEIEAAIHSSPPNGGEAWSRTKAAFQSELSRCGWAVHCRIEKTLNLKVTGMKDGIGVSFQTGNIARAAYDILKLCGAYGANRIRLGVLITPVASLNSEGNKAFFERVAREADFLMSGHGMPLVILGVDDGPTEM